MTPEKFYEPALLELSLQLPPGHRAAVLLPYWGAHATAGAAVSQRLYAGIKHDLGNYFIPCLKPAQKESPQGLATRISATI